MKKIRTDDFAEYCKGRVKRILLRVSFEERSIVIPKLLKGESIDLCAFASEKKRNTTHPNRDFLSSQERSEIIYLKTENPSSFAKDLFKHIKQYLNTDGLNNTLIDISTFRREELLILIAILKSMEIPKTNNCELVYVSASSMAKNWLSRNIIDHRSIIGYPGEIWPSRKTKLVVMLGFEIDRARSIIDNYEPSEILLGIAGKNESITTEFHKENLNFFNDLRRQFNYQQEPFEFSAVDPFQTVCDLEKAIQKDDMYNIIITPLNSKLSTIGAGIYALKHTNVQICYAHAAEYNENTYSTHGEDLYIIPLNDVMQHTF